MQYPLVILLKELLIFCTLSGEELYLKEELVLGIVIKGGKYYKQYGMYKQFTIIVNSIQKNNI